MSQIRVNDLTYHYEGSYDNIFEHMSFSIDTSWKLGFVGRNGRGKTTFLRLLTGELDSGGAIASSVAFDYFPFAVPDESLTTEAVFASLSDAPRWRLEKELNLLEVEPDALERAFSTLSPGGADQGAARGAVFPRRALSAHRRTDQPPRHGSARRGQPLPSAASRGSFWSGHDRAFLDGCVDHILSINRASIEVQKRQLFQLGGEPQAAGRV